LDDTSLTAVDEERFDIFLCFRDSDRHAVERFAKDLRNVGINSWPKDWSVSPEESWRQLLSRPVQKIHALAVFADDDGGPWIDDQVETFIWELIEGDQLVIPVILQSAQRQPKFPVYLRRKQQVDLRATDPNPAFEFARLLSGIRSGEKESRNG
jgi:hypothetical protein